ncbi:hypothetical protein, partial [Rheinheimera sp.]|uniref:hypothetical protein n=1 Tax=Rheinheimera sp. TaxID=1869214 RepID=UPI0026129D0A
MNSIHFPVVSEIYQLAKPVAETDSHQATAVPARKTGLWLVLYLCIAVLLCGFLLISYLQTESQAKADLHNINLTLESRLNAGLLQPVQTQLNSVAQMLDPALLDKSQLEQDKLLQYIQNLTSRFPELPPLTLLSKYGAAVLSTEQTDQSLYFSQIPGLLNKAKLPQLIFEQTADNRLALAVPLFNARQELNGWVATSVRLDSIQKLFAQVEL